MCENNDINNGEIVLNKIHNNISFDIIKTALTEAILKLYKRDGYLIEREFKNRKKFK